jgi:hypothetical protein
VQNANQISSQRREAKTVEPQPTAKKKATQHQNPKIKPPTKIEIKPRSK